MSKKEYLNEESYKKTKNTISIFGTLIVVILWILGLGLIGTGVSASHGMERTHIEGIDNTLKLIYLYLCK